MRKIFLNYLIISATALAIISSGCSKSSDGGGGTTPPVTPPVTPPAGTSDVDYWLTTGDKSSLLAKQTTPISFISTTNGNQTITVDSITKYQTIDGFGYTLTQGSAFVINQLPAGSRASLLTELFGSGSESIGVSYLRVGIGATDLSANVFSYDDMPAGQTDPTLANFSLAEDATNVVPLLKEILAINPNIKIMGSPWSPPVWMKTIPAPPLPAPTAKGGSLNPIYYQAYANYFVKYIQAMKAQGITIDAITPQNEPLNPDNTPSLLMTAPDQAAFIKNNLGPAFAAANITTKIIAYDHNLDMISYPITVLSDAGAKAFVDGSAFHLYGGVISSMSNVHDAFPDKNVYFTEQYTSSNGDFLGDLNWHLKNVIIGSMRNWSRNALEWNLANDPTFGPHTNGGCTECKGALTISSTNITRNVAYYIIAQVAKFVPAGSVRISSDQGSVQTVAFLRPDGKKVLIVLNDTDLTQAFNIGFKGKIGSTSLPAKSVATYMW